MKRYVAAAAILWAAAVPAGAQEMTPALFAPESHPFDYLQSARFRPALQLGARTGFVMGTDAEASVLFIGAGLRIPVAEVAAVEVSLDVWRDEYAEGDADVIHFPLMISGMFYFPLETPTTAPYILAGVGMHNLSFSYTGALDAEEDDQDAEFAFHGGAGLEIEVGSVLAIHMDVRWILLDPDPAAEALKHEKFDTVQFTLALAIKF